MYEEARGMFVQVNLIVAVLNTTIAAVAPLLLSCCTAKCYSKASPHASPAASKPVQYAQAVLRSRRGRVMKMRKFLFYTG